MQTKSRKILTPNNITFFRLILTLLIGLLFIFEGSFNFWVWSLIVFIAISLNEISDFLDGYIARKYQMISDIGKVLDPYSDVMQHLTYFLFFYYKGILPFYFIAIFIYRELSVGFLRNLYVQKGIVLQAKLSGKLKSISYVLVSYGAFLSLVFLEGNFYFTVFLNFLVVLSCVFILLSFLDYLLNFFKLFSKP